MHCILLEEKYMDNEMTLQFLAISENEALARLAIMSFITSIDPTIDEVSECKTIVSEAVSNAIIHGYADREKPGVITLYAMREGQKVTVSIKDEGCGIDNIPLAMEPLYTTKSQLERSGMGFTIMESFSDHLQVDSIVGKGTVITFTKCFLQVPSIAI